MFTFNEIIIIKKHLPTYKLQNEKTIIKSFDELTRFGMSFERVRKLKRIYLYEKCICINTVSIFFCKISIFHFKKEIQK